MSLQLQVPQMAEQIDPALQTHRAYVEEWTESLPFADPLGAFRALFDRVNAFNHAPIKASLRAELVEVLLSPYLHMVDRHSRLTGQ